MPEGDAVRRTAARLDQALRGAELCRAELRVPRFATVDLVGMMVLETAVHGKHLLTRLAGRPGAWTLHHHLRMDGRWDVGPLGSSRAAGHTIRVLLQTEVAQAVGVRLHQVEVRPTDREQLWIGHLGPDVMADGFDAAAAAQTLARSDLPLVEALLDQRLVCGLGTMWACELACEARVNPMTSSARVAGLADALSVVRNRMLAAVQRPAAVRRSLRVFERSGLPCPGCGTPVVAGRVGQPPRTRPTYWCPRCQPAVPGM